MTTNVYTVPEESSVAAAGQLFLNHKLGCLPVVDTDHRLAGILTVTDLWRAYVALQLACTLHSPSPDYSSACKLIEERISGAKRSLKITVSQARHTPQTRWSDHPDAVPSVWGT
jgi:CBS-domain-containing membrane protein